ncbi:MAG: hypothetical protein KA116_11490 [Proteobacteria bacterium]|nr:hypothetical protein [Pseudomonadota bacterium]
MLGIFLSIILSLSTACSSLAQNKEPNFDWDKVTQELEGQGLVGEIHAVVPDRKLIVFTLRDPKDFFHFVHISLVTRKEDVRQKLSESTRHDKVRIKGHFLKIDAPQKHISVDEIETLKKYTSEYPSDHYQYEAQIPAELKDKHEALFLVHAVHDHGHILVLEYKDQILPVYIRNSQLSENLYRNDIIRLKFDIQEKPGNPTHLEVRESDPQALVQEDSLLAQHDVERSIEGKLVLFPKSPQVAFNVFAVEQFDEKSATRRTYTLVNFDDQDLFAQIRALAQAAWDKDSKNYHNGRNKLVHNSINVRVKGRINVVDANQANPQVRISELKNFEIIR